MEKVTALQQLSFWSVTHENWSGVPNLLPLIREDSYMDTFYTSFEDSQYLQVHLEWNMNSFVERTDRMWFPTVTS